MNMKKNSGSAMVLSILLLAFFMALSLNMFYMTQKRAERAGFKVKGQTDFSGIDESSTLGYYELYLAGELVNIGSLYTDDHRTTILSDSSYFTDPGNYTTESGIVTSGTYAGIVLTNYRQYFDSAWNITSGGAFNTTIDQAIVKKNIIDNEKLIERNWSDSEDKAFRLWQNNNYKYYSSVGGYKLTSLSIATHQAITIDSSGGYVLLNFSEPLSTGTTWSATAKYKKQVSIGDVRYAIEATENIKFTVTGSAINTNDLKKESIEITDEQLTEITVEKGGS